MNVEPGIDPELLDLLRAADPIRNPREKANAGFDTESALRLLAPELRLPPRRARVGRRRRSVLRVAVLAVATAAIAFVIANVASSGNGSEVPRAEAQTILRHVRDALAWPPHAIYEEDSVTTNTEHDGATHTVEYHEWLDTSPPYNNRLDVIVNGKVLWEQAFLNGRRDLYDPQTNAIYLAPGVAIKHVVGCHRCSSDTPQSNSALSEVEYLLNQPNVTINRTAVAGKPAIKLTFDRGRFTYWISLHTYQPLQVKDRDFPGTTRYPIARLLTGSAASPTLLSLPAQHPNATINHGAAAYSKASQVVNEKGAQTGR